MVQWMRTDSVDVEPLAQAVELAFSFALNNSVTLRESGQLPDRFVDVHFQDMMSDPVATLRAVYDRMDRPFTDAHAKRIRAYLAAKPKGKFGTHHYSPEEWGFTAEGLRKDLAPYIEHFGVSLE